MFKLLLLSLAITGMALGQAPTQPVQTPTLQGNYTWTGTDLWTFGNLGFTTTPTQCPNGQVMSGFTATLAPNCAAGGGVSYNVAFTDTLASDISSTATKLTFTGSTAGFPATGCGIMATEFMCYTSLDPDGFSLDGLSRGVYNSTPASHTTTSPDGFWTGVIAAFAPITNTPFVVVFGTGSSALVAINNQVPNSFNPAAVLEINTGSNETYVGTDGTIHQFALTHTNALSESSMGQVDPVPVGQDLIADTYNVLQITNQYQTQQLIGLGGGIAGGIVLSQPATIGPPVFADSNPSGSTAYSYLCQDHAGLVPGTVATRMDAASLSFPITVQCPRQAGVAAYDILRTAGGISQGLLVSDVVPGTSVNDFPATDTTTPLATITSNTSTTFLKGIPLASGTVTPSAIAAATCADTTLTVAGVDSTARISSVTPPSALGNLSLNAYVSGTNAITLHFCNVSAASVTPPSGTYQAAFVN
jgi:hypothetical protein